MPIDDGTIYQSVRIRLDKLQADLNSVNAKLNNFSTQSKKRASGFQGAWQAAFTAIGFAGVQAFQALIRAGRNAIGVFSGFQQSMTNTASVTGAVGEELRVLGDAAKTAGETTRFTARQAADALYFLGSAGFSARQSVDALNGVLQLAGATQSDLATTAESVASIISQYSLEASEAGRVSNVFAAAIGNSQATMDKLTNAFRQVGPVAAGLGISLEQTTGALQLLFNAGFRGQQAGRALKSALADLASPTANLKKVFSGLGVEMSKVNPETEDFADIIDVLAGSGATTANIIDAFGKVAGPQLAVLIKQGGDALRGYTDDVTGTSAAARAYAIQNDTLAGSLDFLKSKLEGVAIEIIGKMEPGMRGLIDTFIEFLEQAKPFGIILGNILNVILKISGTPLKILTKGFEILGNIFKTSEEPMRAATTAIEDVTQAIEKAGEIQQTSDRLSKLTDEYERLSGKANKTESEQDRLKKVISDIANIVPDAVTVWDDYGNAIEISGQKSRTAAKQLLDSRKAILEASISALKIQEPLLQRIRDRDAEEVKSIKKERARIEELARLSVKRLSNADDFFNGLRKLENEGIVTTEKFNKLIEEQEFTLIALGVAIKDDSGNFRSYAEVITEAKQAMIDAETAMDNLDRTITKEISVEQKYNDAITKLEELELLNKELEGILNGINEIDKLNPVDEEAPGDIDEIGQLLEDFWKNYKKGLQDATKEASFFGNIQDELKAKLDFLKRSIIELINAGIDPNTISIQKLKMEYDLTLAVLNSYIKAEKENLELQKQKEKDQEKLTGIIEDYTNKLEKLETKEEDLIDLERQRALAIVQALDVEEDAIRKATDAVNEYFDALGNDEAVDNFKLTTEEILSEAESLASALISLTNAVADNRIMQLDKELEETLRVRGLLEETERERLQREIDEATEAGDIKLVNEKQNDLKRLELTEEFEQKKAQVQYRAALAEWLLKVASVSASAAKGIAAAIATLNPFVITATTLAEGSQVAAVAIAKPKPPAFQSGGVYLNSSAGTEGAPAILHNQEMVLNTDQMKNLFNMIQSGNAGQGQITRVTVIYNVDGIEMTRQVADVMNEGIVTLKPGVIRK
jgi:TP901 family phage tail tape measure protein